MHCSIVTREANKDGQSWATESSGRLSEGHEEGRAEAPVVWLSGWVNCFFVLLCCV